MKIRPKYGRYYDLIRVPHGHIPAPLTNLWSKLPIPVKEVRDENYYFCPVCGEPSFFKIRYACWKCQGEFEYDPSLEEWAWKEYKRKMRKDYFRNFLKRIEYLILPFLVLIGKAWYVRSYRLHPSDREFQEKEQKFFRWVMEHPDEFQKSLEDFI